MQEFHSNIELYYTEPNNIKDNIIKIVDQEFKHLTKVMRHKVGDNIFVTNGIGTICSAEINQINKEFCSAEIVKKETYDNPYRNIYFCIANLKNSDRLEFALEKCTELGLTNFIIFNSKRSVSKNIKLERIIKILLSAMKQSLRSYLPKVTFEKSFEDIIKIYGEKIILEQNSEKHIDELKILPDKKYYFIFGPEGGLDEQELKFINSSNIFYLTKNRLRTETAVIACASQILV